MLFSCLKDFNGFATPQIKSKLLSMACKTWQQLQTPETLNKPMPPSATFSSGTCLCGTGRCPVMIDCLQHNNPLGRPITHKHPSPGFMQPVLEHTPSWSGRAQAGACLHVGPVCDLHFFFFFFLFKILFIYL